VTAGGWAVYGATGYTGRLVAELAVARGQRPVLVGRRPGPLAELAGRLGLDHRVAALDDPSALDAVLGDVAAVAHCAGPFSATAAPMVAACLRTGTHYLDITGEVAVFEAMWERHDAARAAGVALVPGAGFDVVPSDTLAATVARRVTQPVRVALAITMAGGVSAGTARTAVEALGEPALARVHGRLVPAPADRLRRRVDLGDRMADAVAISWGDLSTAHRSTGAPDVSTYLAVPGVMAGLVSAVGSGRGPLSGLLRRPSVRRALDAGAARIPGPSPRQRATTRGRLWCEVVGADGTVATGTMTTPNAYALTADSVVRTAMALTASAVPPGAWTPTQALGTEVGTTLAGVTLGPVTVRPGPTPDD
jgi:saccharopine dehydrogenase (NAD+, L-lysine-forming)